MRVRVKVERHAKTAPSVNYINMESRSAEPAAAQPNPLLHVLMQAQAALLGPKARPSVPLASLLRSARPGDLLLFRNKLLRSVAQRLVTTSEWDHVAIVVRRPRHRLGGGSSGGSKKEEEQRLCLLEAIAGGVLCFDLESRLREYGRDFAECICWRPMHCERTPEREAALARFVAAVDRRAAFSNDFLAMAFTPRRAPPWVAAAAPAERFQVEPAYFCSQLVCAAWRAAGLLPLHVQPASFWPGDCGARGAVEGWLVDGCSLGEESRLDWEDGGTLHVGVLERNERE